MENFWKWAQRIAYITTIISFLKGWNMKDIIIFVKEFWNNFTPWQFLFFLSIIVLLYRFVTFLVNIHKSTKELKNLDKKIADIDGNIDELKKWIGLFSYKDGYHDLKGKIQFYIKDALENKKPTK